MRTTVDISDAVLAELRAKASAEGRSIKLVIEETLQLGLAERRKRSGRFRVKPLNPGIKAAFRAVSMNQLYDQLEAGER